MDEKVREEAIARLKILEEQGLDEAVLRRYKKGELCYSQLVRIGAVNCLMDDSPDFQEIIEKLEQEYGFHVYYCIYSDLGFAQLLTLLTVDKYRNEWEGVRKGMQKGLAFAYAYNMQESFCEAGDMTYKFIDGAMIRTV